MFLCAFVHSCITFCLTFVNNGKRVAFIRSVSSIVFLFRSRGQLFYWERSIVGRRRMWQDRTSGDVFRVKSRDPVLYITNGTKVNTVVGDSRGVSKLSQQQ